MQPTQLGWISPSPWQPLWAYLRQPLFDAKQPVILNPWEFQRRWWENYLEQCWQQEIVQQLENCWAQRPYQPDTKTIDSIDTNSIS